MSNLKDTKPIKRRILVNTDNRIAPRASDYCTLTIYPSGVVGFRPNRSKREYTLTLSFIYKMALRRGEAEDKPAKKVKISRGLIATENANEIPS